MIRRKKKADSRGRLENRILLASSIVCLSILLGSAIPAWADIIVYENLPTSLATPPNISFHNAVGPIIADEFVPIAHGQVTTVTWWGSAAPSSLWELVLQNNDPALGLPALTPPGNIATGGVKAVGVSAVGVPYAPLPGVFQFTADFSDFAFFKVDAGADYWITIANFENGWTWALALSGPSIGSENFNAHSSIGGPPFPVGTSCTDGGPHCGPWTDIHTDFGVRISAVPEPMSLVLLGIGLVALAAVRRWKVKVG